MENAHRIPVTNANRNEFVRLYLDWILNKGIYEKFRAFYLGFHSVCASNALIVSSPFFSNLYNDWLDIPIYILIRVRFDNSLECCSVYWTQ